MGGPELWQPKWSSLGYGRVDLDTVCKEYRIVCPAVKCYIRGFSKLSAGGSRGGTATIQLDSKLGHRLVSHATMNHDQLLSDGWYTLLIGRHGSGETTVTRVLEVEAEEAPPLEEEECQWDRDDDLWYNHCVVGRVTQNGAFNKVTVIGIEGSDKAWDQV